MAGGRTGRLVGSLRLGRRPNECGWIATRLDHAFVMLWRLASWGVGLHSAGRTPILWSRAIPPDDGAKAMTDTTTNEPTAKRESVAKHELIAAAGGEHTAIDKAIGIRYTDKASGTVFEYLIPGATAGSAITMLALFGAKTKATNEASRVRNGTGGDVTAQFEAIDEVFENITNGVWREKAEGGGGSRTDKAVLARVLVDWLESKGKLQGTVDTYQHRLETEDGYMKKVLSNDEVKSLYKKAVGKTGPAADDLA